MKKLPPFVILTLITVIAAVLLAVTNAVTLEPIAVAASNAAFQARQSVLPDAQDFAELAKPDGVDSLYQGTANGQNVGYTATVTTAGFGGPIEVTVGFTDAGTLTGLSVGGSKFAETAGLGAKAKESAFTAQFIGKTAPLALKRDVDAISGATITSTAVVNAVNAAAQSVNLAAK